MPRPLPHMGWRGFLRHDGTVMAWPTLLAEHNDFHRAFQTTDEDFALRWRQWSPGREIDFDRVTSTSPFTQDTAEALVTSWVAKASA